MARLQSKVISTGRTVLVVDDNIEYLAATERLLLRNGHTVIAADNPERALGILQRERVDLVLVDFFMPEMTGQEFVERLRLFNPLVQVILQTGYASEQPPRELLRRLDIQGYYDKADGPDKLLLWTDVGLKAAYTVQLIEKSRRGLKYILDATPELHRVKPLDDLLSGVLTQATGLLGAADAFLAVRSDVPAIKPAESDAFVAVAQDAADLIVRAATGKFQPAARIEQCFSPEEVAELRRGLQQRRAVAGPWGTVVPLTAGDALLGAIYMDRAITDPRDVELLEVFANQAAVAIHNAHLYEMAALDPLTGVFTRRFFHRALAHEIQHACVIGKSLGLLVVDVDGMKRINDTGGHLQGDEALVTVARALRAATTSVDSVGRFGGDEFVVLLPGADAKTTATVADRVLSALAGATVASSSGPLPVRVSVGASVLAPPPAGTPGHSPRSIDHLRLANRLIQRADQTLYAAKNGGRARAATPRMLSWPPGPPADETPQPVLEAVS